MASVPVARRARPSDRTGAVPHTDLTHPLDRLKGVIRVFVALDVLLFVALFLTLWFWVGVGVDFGLFKAFGVDVAQATKANRLEDFGFWVTVGVTALLSVLLVVLSVLRVIGLVNKDLSLTSLALVLEKRHPKLLGDRLITAIEMADVESARRQGYSADMVRHTIAEARERMARVNVLAVFNWGRLWWKAAATAGVWVLAVVAALVIHATATRSVDPARGFAKLCDVAGIYAERNVLFQPTPWPRRAMVEVTDFNDKGHENEMRVGKNSPTAPKVTARVVKWVVPEKPWWNPKKGKNGGLETNPDGWRALRVSDLPWVERQCGVQIPPPDAPDWSAENLQNVRIDDLEREYGWDENHPTLKALAAAADHPWNGRKLRKLAVPGVLRLKVDGVNAGSQVRVTGDVTSDASGRYTADITTGNTPTLTESVRFTLAAEDFVTARRFVTLVNPPVLVDLYRDEYQPAYLHYAAPILGDGQAAVGPPAQSTPDPLFYLRGRTQKVAHKQVSITGDKVSSFSVPVGSELFLTAETDKDLRSVEIRPVGTPLAVPEFFSAEAKRTTLDAYGKAVVSEEFVPLEITRDPAANPAVVELDGGDRKGLTVKPDEFQGKRLGVRRFTVKFEGKRAVRQLDRPTEFELAMEDVDGVQATRKIVITAADDAPPQVDVYVDPVVRRVGGVYMVTPVARIPFLPDSKVTDANGLSEVRFEFRKQRKEAGSVVNVRAIGAAALIGNSLSAVPTLGLPATAVHGQAQWDLRYAGDIPQGPTGAERLPGYRVPRFDDELKLLAKQTGDYVDRETVARADSALADRLVQAEMARQKISTDGMDAKQAAATREKLLSDLLTRMRAEASDLQTRMQAEAAADPKAQPKAVVVRKIEFRDPMTDSFDLMKYMPELVDKNAPVQPQYTIDLYVVAKDTNVELSEKDGKTPAEPKAARNQEAIRIVVVSEQDLLAEIGKDEQTQVTRMEDAVAKANGGQKKLTVELALLRGLGSLTPQERANQLLSSQVRFTDIGLDLSKCKELLTAMKTEYEKLYREMEVNRLTTTHLRKYRNEANTSEELLTGYLDLLGLVLEKGLPKAEASLEVVRGKLANAQTPAAVELDAAAADYAAFKRLMDRLENQVGTGEDVRRRIQELRDILEKQSFISQGLIAAIVDINEGVRRPDLILPKVVEVQAGKTVKVKMGVKWKLYAEKSLRVEFDPPATSDVKVPKVVDVPSKDEEDVTTVEFEVTGGEKPGVTTVMLRPSKPKVVEKTDMFRPVELTIETKK